MRFPIATLTLVAALASAYFYMSNALLYIPDSTVNSLAAGSPGSPLNLVSHLFVHVGIVHIVGNLLPLLAFGLVFELSATSVDLFAIFFSSGILASLLFSLLNQGVALVGASAGVSGLIGAAVSARPRLSLPLLLVVPLFFNLGLLPWLAKIPLQQQEMLFQQENKLAGEFQELVGQNRTEEAIVVEERIATVSANREAVARGVERESTTPADFLVHLSGVVVGVAYVFFLKRGLFIQGAEEIRRAVLWFRNYGVSP